MSDDWINIKQLSKEGLGQKESEPNTLYHNALPKEMVLVKPVKKTKGKQYLIATEIKNPHPNRAPSQCDFFHSCGGCSLHHLNYPAQQEHKRHHVEQSFKDAAVKTPMFEPTIESSNLNYRHRARVSLRWDAKKDQLLMGFREKNGRYITQMDNCVILTQALNSCLFKLKALLAECAHKDAIPQLEITQCENHISIIIRHLKPFSESEIKKLLDFEKNHNIFLYSHEKKTIDPLSNRCLHAYQIDNIHYRFKPTHFIQINPFVNQKMVQTIIGWLNLKPDDIVLDLFCGIGNFSLACAAKSQAIHGYELSEDAILQARANAQLNGFENAFFYAQNLYEKPLAHQNTSATVMLLDPPRSGALEIVKQLQNYPNIKTIAYVACDPESLARDAAFIIQAGFALSKIAIADMFPHTSHVETLALFQKR